MGKFYVQSLWIGPILGELPAICLNSFIKNKIDFHLYTYDVIQNVPPGVIIKDANKIIDKCHIFKDNKLSYATFADWFRIKLLYDVGGWWVDCDVLFVKKFNFKAKYVFATESYISNAGLEIRICNAVLKMPRKNIVAEKILNRIKIRLNDITVKEISWTEIGAGYLMDVLIDEGLEQYIVIPEVFCPNAWNDFDKVSSTDCVHIKKDTYAIHLWNQMWRWNNQVPFENLMKGSILDQAKNEFST